MDPYESKCPICLTAMDFDIQDGMAWMSCPNGCPTEFEAPILEPAADIEQPEPVLQARAAGS